VSCIHGFFLLIIKKLYHESYFVNSTIAVARQFGDKKKNFNGEKLWARGYAVSTVGFEEAQIHSYIKHQEQLDGLGSNEPGEF
jgi:putative transposase